MISIVTVDPESWQTVRARARGMCVSESEQGWASERVETREREEGAETKKTRRAILILLSYRSLLVQRT